MNHLNTKRIYLRRFNTEDIPDLIQMNSDSEVMEYFPKILTKEESIAFFVRILLHYEKHNFGLFSMISKETQKFIGFCGLLIPNFKEDFTPCVEIGWRIKKEFWGKGYAPEAAKEVLNFGFRNLGLKKIFSFTSVLNYRSISVMEKIGMKFEKEFLHPNIERENKLALHKLYSIQNE